MDLTTIGDIEKKIGYTFKNKRLLSQAFVRKSYSKENPETLDNEVLEFYGDEALEYYFTRKLYSQFSSLTNDKQFYSKRSEHELTEIKSQNVDTDSLANCIYVLGLQDYLQMNKSDIKNNVQNSTSVMADLFEAIVGAVVVDSDWEYKKISEVCSAMLNLADFDINYIKWLNNWCEEKGYKQPMYTPRFCFGTSFFTDQNQESFSFLYLNYQWRYFNTPFSTKVTGAILIVPELNIKITSEKGSEYASYMDCAEKAYKIIQSKEMKNVIGKPDRNDAVNKLNELYQKGFISEPEYSFQENHDEDGNPLWYCECYIDELERLYSGDSSGKKEAKKAAAFEALKELFKNGLN